MERVIRQRLGGKDHRRSRGQASSLVDTAGIQRGCPGKEHAFPLLPREVQSLKPGFQGDTPARVRFLPLLRRGKAYGKGLEARPIPGRQ